MSGEQEKKLLLVVDDNPSHIHVVHSILKNDYKIRIATNGAKALDLATVLPLPDLILLNVMNAGHGWLRGLRPVESQPGDAGYPGDFPYAKNRGRR